ncbi:MAG: hypothetical protein KAT65_04475, partial [Methanophagales archaeon]|nr:hypothetical protein [Methanophagales archaeon]
MMNGENMNHEQSHRQFMWTDWLVIGISIVVTIVLGIGGYTGVITELESILSSLIAIFIGAVIILDKTSTKIMQNKITDLQNAIEEDINKIVSLQGHFGTITTLLKDIIYKVTDRETKHDNIDRATKRLNGVNQILKQKMVDIETAKKASRRLKESKASFYAVSTSTITECFEPVFFEYFAEQICICKGKKSANKYLLSWDNVSGDDNEKLKRFLREYLDIDWVGNAEIHKSNGGRTIRIFNDENSVEIMRNDKGKKAILKIFANFSAERYFVYDHDIIEQYREE